MRLCLPLWGTSRAFENNIFSALPMPLAR